MLNIHWAGEKPRKINCLNIMSSDYLQAVKCFSEDRKGPSMFEPQCKPRESADTAEELKMATEKNCVIGLSMSQMNIPEVAVISFYVYFFLI